MAWYIKLDMDWYDDPKVLEFKDLYGKAALVDVVKLFCALGEFFGQIDLNESAQRLHLKKVLSKTDKSLRSFLEKCASVDLIDKEAYEAFGRVGSARSIRDGEARSRRKQRALDGANKRWGDDGSDEGSKSDA